MKNLYRAFLPRNRTFVLFVVMLFFVGCASLMVVRHIHELFLSHDEAQKRSEILLAANIVNERINTRLLQLQALARMQVGTDKNESMRQKFNRLSAETADMGYMRLSIADANGFAITTDGFEYNVYDDDLFQRALRGFAYTSGVVIDRMNNKNSAQRSEVVTFLAPMVDGALVVGAIAATMRLQDAHSLLEGIRIPYNGSALFLIDQNFCVIACAGNYDDADVAIGRSCNFFSYMSEMLLPDERGRIEQRMLSATRESDSYTTDKDTSYVSFTSLPSTNGWRLISISSEDGIRASQNTLLLKAGAVFLAVVAFVLIMLFWLYITNWRYRRVEKFSRAMIDASSFNLISISPEGDVQYCEQRFFSLLGMRPSNGTFSLAPLMRQDQHIFPLPDMKERDSFRISLSRVSDGVKVHLLVQILGEMEGGFYPAAVIDVTSDEQMQERIRFLAYIDPLTLLPNSESFSLRVEELGRMAQKSPFECFYIFININDSRKILELFSDAAYRDMMKRVAERLLDMARESGIKLYHVRNDKFVLIAENHAKSDAEFLCAMVHACFDEPFEAAQYKFTVKCRVGVVDCAEYRNGKGVPSSDMFRYGELALSMAKATDSLTFCLDRESYSNLEDGLEMERELSKALENGEFEMYCQPIYDANSDTITCAETLIRWNSPKRGMVPPAVFIPIAERNGDINKIGDFVIQKSLEIAKNLEKYGVMLEFNVSPVQFGQTGFVDKLVTSFRDSGVSKGSVGMEITESCFISSTSTVNKKLEAIRRAGINILIDDFGTGYSSLAYIRDIPMDFIKVDRSFINGIESSNTLCAILESIVSMCRKINVRTIAEGIETSDQLREVLKSGCRLIQGFFIARPMPLDDFYRFVERFNSGER